MTCTIVIVDDDAITRETLKAYFEDEGYSVLQARNGDELAIILARHKISLVLLDIHLPGKDGLTITREIRAESNIPIVLITGRSDQLDRIIGLEMGADDYIVKPFEPREILARFRSLQRRHNSRQGMAEQREKRFGPWSFHLGKRRLWHDDGREIRLTSAEFDLLAAFVGNPGWVLTRDKLLDLTPHHKGDPFDRSIDSLVRRLRRVLEADPANPHYITTVHGSGYMFTVDVS
ncbi:response regulator [Telmatospirillum sp.]|uniref:response regulator n=1 Tax=Telmatospirillum sp. TaxID=2079197 RepID=UPI00284AB378|nr:response regulator [Telmatospirillum sp.]MDR3440081.1 response regulator [Telmatospirillum sp.]